MSDVTTYEPALPRGEEPREQWLSISELAARWGISTNTLRSWRHRRQPPHARNVQFGKRRLLYKLSDVRAFEAERFGEPLE